MFKLFEKEELTPKKRGIYQKFDISLLESGKIQTDTQKMEEIKNNIKNIFENLDIKIKFSNIVDSFQFVKIEIIPDSIADFKNILKNKKVINFYLKNEIKQNENGFCFEFKKDKKDILYLKDILQNEQKNNININFGKDFNNNIVNVNVEKLPHLLIGGTTGSGKSVFLNTFITSLCYNYAPEELRLILIDPKKTEFTQFEKIPHLLFNITSDISKVNDILDYVTKEMYKRYEVISSNGFKNINEYNEQKEQKIEKIIVIIDELADIMLQDKKAIEQKLCRIAQLSRACGIYLIIATQRPSTDIITGLIKANFPSRLCFKVASVYDSRTILDAKGGEQLQGNGDALLKSVDMIEAERIQAPFISTKELEKIFQEVKK